MLWVQQNQTKWILLPHAVGLFFGPCLPSQMHMTVFKSCHESELVSKWSVFNKQTRWTLSSCFVNWNSLVWTWVRAEIPLSVRCSDVYYACSEWHTCAQALHRYLIIKAPLLAICCLFVNWDRCDRIWERFFKLIPLAELWECLREGFVYASEGGARIAAYGGIYCRLQFGQTIQPQRTDTHSRYSELQFSEICLKWLIAYCVTLKSEQ